MWYFADIGQKNQVSNALCTQHLERITHLQKLIAVEEKKLFAAMKREKSQVTGKVRESAS